MHTLTVLRYRCFPLWKYTLLAVVFTGIARGVVGQEWAQLQADEKEAKNFGNIARSCFKDAAAYSANQAKFTAYYQNYFFPAMTRTEPDKLGELGKMREDLFKRGLWSASNAAAQNELTGIAYQAAVKIVGAQNPPFHPAVRYNAALILGLLDEQYSTDGKTPPKPYPAANKALTAIVDSATTGNRFPPSVVLGAVIGLERHAQFRQSLPPENVTAMTAALLKLVNNEKPVLEMDRDAYAWLQLKAASALVRMGTLGEKNAIHNALVKLTSSLKSVDDRCAAAAMLDKLDYKDVKLDDASTADPLFKLSRDVAAAEDEQAQEFEEQHVTGGFAPGGQFPGAVGRGFEPGAYGAGMEVVETFPRRQALARLWDLRTGLRKVKPALTPEAQKKAEAVLAALDKGIAAAGNKDTVELTLVDELRKMAIEINAALPAAAAAANEVKEDKTF